MPNLLEEKLRGIKNRKIILREEIKSETDRRKLQELIKQMQELNNEETQCLRDLGVI